LSAAGRAFPPESLVDFAARIVPRMFPKIPKLPKHWRRILRIFELAWYGGQRWRVNIPPRHGKTLCGLIAIAWFMLYAPHLRNLYATYGQEFSESQGRLLARVLRAVGVRLAVQKADYFETLEGGGCFLTSRDGVLLGKGVDGLAVIDDPYKDRAEAESPTIQARVWEWYQDTFKSRIEGEASVYLLHQRWNLQDMSEKLKETEPEWSALIIQALNERDEALWPEVKSAEAWKAERETNPYGFASMGQQDPMAKGSQMFHGPARYDLQAWLLGLDPKKGKDSALSYRWAIGVDPATTAKASADHSALVLEAAKGEGDTMITRIVEVRFEQIETPELVMLAKDMRAAWVSRVPSLPLIVEGVGLGAGVPQAIRRIAPAEQVISPQMKGDKKTRATGYASAWNQGRVLVPSNAPWAGGFVLEHLRFTGAKGGKDDRVDGGAHAWNYLWRPAPAITRGPGPNRIF